MAEKNKGGRPPFELSEKEFSKIVAMIRIQCTQDEICSVYGVTDKTLNVALKKIGQPGFSDLYKKHSCEGNASLRRAQWKAATEKLNPTMLVWCGKQYLGQTDKIEQENKNTDIADALIHLADNLPG